MVLGSNPSGPTNGNVAKRLGNGLQLRQRGFKSHRYLQENDRCDMMVIGADEVGRGSIAGPVTVCAVLAPDDLDGLGVTDSKKLSAKRRKAIDKDLRDHIDVKFAIASRPATDIDKYGIAECLKQCFAEVVQKTMALTTDPEVRVLIDGDPIKGFPFPAEYIIKGDAKVWVIGAASIIAKVWRDELMADESRFHPGYGWDVNAGYGTHEHATGIQLHGLTPLHRTTFCRSFIKVAESESAADIITDLFG